MCEQCYIYLAERMLQTGPDIIHSLTKCGFGRYLPHTKRLTVKFWIIIRLMDCLIIWLSQQNTDQKCFQNITVLKFFFFRISNDSQ